MNEPKRYFKWLYRLLAVCGLGAVVLVGLFVLSLVWQQNRWFNRQAVQVAPEGGGKPAAENLRFSELEDIRGSRSSMLHVEAAQGGRSGSFSSGGYGGQLRNLVFLDGTKTSARWLFPRNTQLLSSVQKLCACDGDERGPVVAIYVAVRRVDSNDNGRIDDEDRVVPALMRPDGRGYRELSAAVDRIIDSSVSGDGMVLSILVQNGNALRFRQYAIPGFDQVADQLVTKIVSPG